MILPNLRETANEGDLVQLVSPRNKFFLVRLVSGEQLQTHRGVLLHDNLIGVRWGSKVLSHIGSPFYLLQPSIKDLLENIRRTTQIMYPKDIGYILINMGIGPGMHVLEAGTGSGALTTAMAWAVGSTGKVTSYEIRPDVQNLARKNLSRFGLDDRVVLKLQDIAQGFEEYGVDALFLDVPNPFDYLNHVRKALKPGGQFGAILPTTNQVTSLLVALDRHMFGFVEVSEVLLRHYKPVQDRLRPTDRMVAHTGFLVFARPVFRDEPDVDSPEE